MRNPVVTFNKIGYDPFIDFLKAYAIIFVVVAHIFPTSLWNYCLFQVWADMQVPIFILIQAFHAYKNGAPIIKRATLLNRIIIPFVLVQGLTIFFYILFFQNQTNDVLISSIISGGIGPGSYYFWIYLQVAIILIIVWPIINKLTRGQVTWLFLMCSVFCEVLFSLINLPDYIYRLLAVRYLFLIPLALIWVDEGVLLNVKNIILSIISIIFVLFFSFIKIDLEPLFYNTGWACHRWICYYYLPVLLTYALWLLYNSFFKDGWMSSFVKEIGKSSYGIYLVQMSVFVLFPIQCMDFIELPHIRLLVWMLLILLLSIGGGIILNNLMYKIFLVRHQ